MFICPYGELCTNNKGFLPWINWTFINIRARSFIAVKLRVFILGSRRNHRY